MLNKKNRISDSSLIKKLLDEGMEHKNKAFIFKYQEAQHGEPRFAIIVSSKIDKRAVIRNKLKRQTAEAIRLHLEKCAKGYNVVVIVRSASKEMSYQELENSILDFFKLLP